MTTITFERSGGIIGNEIQLELDLNSLPDDESQYLLRLISEADFFNLPENLASNSTPDEFQYRITVDAGSASHTVRVTDTTMPKSLSTLVKELTMLKILQ